ncbi:transcription antitermination factor NusB [Sulfurihydrogenibium azorense]|jgi:N utilization substance protein B|uniref:transcription antitermination factor NusB n=1 Tax=Sulfurihydrogenibium azorense TaxID=309806 RepID=UPI0024099796|nr:transcription antitermination factor NusB [Sulfurihydrogenibium azorense]MDM7273003.1 transcription antitermination factor NusB [Sulfurihydrogenibium azorense]
MKQSIKNIQRQARELLLKVFYTFDQKGEPLEDILKEYTNLKEISPEVINYAKEIISFFNEKKDKVDEMIKSHLEKWRFERLGYIEKALLRIAITDFLKLKEKGREENFMIKRIILDTLDLVECYTGSKKSVKFVNGILGRVVRELFKGYEDSFYIRSTQ